MWRLEGRPVVLFVGGGMYSDDERVEEI